MNTRNEIEQRIVDILSYIHFWQIEEFKKNLSLFEEEELKQILSYLESWSLEWIRDFLLNTKKNILVIHEEKRQIRNKRKLEKMKKMEEEDKKNDLIQLNF